MLQDQPGSFEPAPLSAGERAHWLEETLLVSEWLDNLCLAASEMNSARWWRLGCRLGLAKTGPKGPLGLVAAWREEAVHVQRELVDRLEAGTLDRDEARAGFARLAEMVPAMHRELLRAAGSPCWRVGLARHRLSVTVGLERPGFLAGTGDTVEVMAQFRRWKALSAPELIAKAQPPAAPPPKTWQKSGFHQLLQPLLEGGEWPVFGAIFRASERKLAAEHRDIPADGPMVSVVMAVRNRAKTVGETVRCVTGQTWPHWELLVCDDGSDDGTADAACAAGDRRVRALRLARGGAALARNRGLFEARGEYIAYLDPDSLWHPAFLETMVRALEAHRGRWCAFARLADVETPAAGAPRLRSVRAPEFSYERLAEKDCIRLGSFLHRAELPRLFGGFTESLRHGQDWDLGLKYTFAQEAVCVDRCLALHRHDAHDRPDAVGHDEHETDAPVIAGNLRSHYAGGLAGPGRGAKRRVTVVCCDQRPGDMARGKALAAALRSGGFDAQERCVAIPAGSAPPQAFDPRAHLESVAGGVVVCVGAFPHTLGVGLAAAAQYGEGVVLDLTEADVDDTGRVPEIAARAAVWTTGNPRVDRLLEGRATFLGGYPGEGLVDNRPEARRVLWAGRPDGGARPTPAELALCADLPDYLITDRQAERWNAALFWPVMAPAPQYSLDPFALARAFATGAPVIIGDPAGPDELARQEVVRWVNPEDDEALRDAIDEALERRGPTGQRTENARRLYQRLYSVQAAATQFAVVWERATAAAAKANTPTPWKRR